MKTLIVLLTFVISAMVVSAEEMSQAKWCHQLFSNRLVGDKASELRIHSGIYTGVLGHNASQRFGQKVRVQAWGKPFTVTSRVYQRPDLERDGATYKEVFTVTLYKTEDPKEMRAEFEHIVYRNEKVYLRFAGITIVDNRWKGA